MDAVEYVSAFFLVCIVAVLLSVLLCLPVYWLWNWLVPSIFSLRAISVGEAWGLSILCNLLFKSTVSKKD